MQIIFLITYNLCLNISGKGDNFKLVVEFANKCIRTKYLKLEILYMSNDYIICSNNWAVVLHRRRHRNFNRSLALGSVGETTWSVLAWFHTCGSYLLTLLPRDSFCRLLLLPFLTFAICYSLMLDRAVHAFLLLIALYLEIAWKNDHHKVNKNGTRLCPRNLC